MINPSLVIFLFHDFSALFHKFKNEEYSNELTFMFVISQRESPNFDTLRTKFAFPLNTSLIIVAD